MINEYYESVVDGHYRTIARNNRHELLILQRNLSDYYSMITGDPESALQSFDMANQMNLWAIEDAWNCWEENRIDASSLPANKKQFKCWYHSMRIAHKEKFSNFFKFLSEKASLEQIAYYVLMESTQDGRFDDIIALSQVGLSKHAKIVAAENYWDEMGHGEVSQMHTVLFEKSSNYLKNHLYQLGLIGEEIEVPLESLRNGNMLLMYSTRRKHIFRLLGIIGLLEETAPDGFRETTRGLKRLKVPEEVIYYHELHIGLDAEHATDWFKHVIDPLIDSNDARLIKEIALGISIRYNLASDYYQGIGKQIKTLAAIAA
jgi:hypothetical protein